LRFLILSDMHANAEALAAVLARVRRKRFDATLVLGDLVGYGASPNQVVDAIRELDGPLVGVRGNHDKVVTGVSLGGDFQPSALQVARWTAERLTAANLRYLRDLPMGPLPVSGDVAICHGSPLDEDAYVFSAADALEIFSQHPLAVTFFGHTHIPSIFSIPAGGGPFRGGELHLARLDGTRGVLALDPGRRYLINPGSIGQPRDRDPRAAYMTYDSRRQVVTWHRVRYAVERARQRIVQAGLPRTLGDRLLLGV
jgi:predicted phosphodiesterase